MCVGRYAAKVMRNERSEMEHNRSEMPANGTQHICIPAGCDFAIKRQFDVVAFRWNASYWYTYCRHFEKIPFRFAPLHLFCIPAYTHQIPNGISCRRTSFQSFTHEISKSVSFLRRIFIISVENWHFFNEVVMRNEFGALRVLCVLRVLRWSS